MAIPDARMPKMNEVELAGYDSIENDYERVMGTV